MKAILKKILELESQVSTISTLKKKLSVYKDEVVDLQAASAGTKAQLAKQKRTIESMQARVNDSEAEKKILNDKLEGLKSELEAAKDSESSTDNSSFTSAADALEATTGAAERLTRLEKENRLLKKQVQVLSYRFLKE